MTQRKGWYGGAEKAETFFFEHSWVPVPGHPAEVATCGICGLNRWSDEHMSQAAAAEMKPYGDVAYADPGYQKDRKKRYPVDTADHCRAAWSYINQAANAAKYSPAQRERIKSRIAGAAKKFGIELNREDAELHERLRRNYGPVTAEMDMASGRAAEDMVIAKNKQSPEARAPHTFMPAEHSKGDQPRCLMCGQAPDAAIHTMSTAAEETPAEPAAAQTLTWPAPVSSVTWPGGSTTTSGTTITMNIAGSDVSTLARTLNAAALTSQVQEREATSAAEVHEPVRAFLTEVNGHTLLTAPASVFAEETEKALGANKHYLWMQGRFVGAEKANRNGAFWKTEDLELGELSVRNGPLNWLHEARHVIGTIANTQMVTRNVAADTELDQPYIQAASAIWRWIYPDEAWVVEQASDQNKLWYSMECISEEVACVGDGGCGARAAYGDYVKGEGATCEHMRQRSATRHFANPTFLGGAVIVPPVRPGWAEANATVMRQAASLAEHAFEQAGKPDVAATDWEQLMAQVLRFAGVS